MRSVRVLIIVHGSVSFLLEFLFGDKYFTKREHCLPKRAKKILRYPIIGLADSLSLSVIAEGVENIGQYQFLKQAGCHAFQGYFFSHPLAINEFETKVRKKLVKS